MTEPHEAVASGQSTQPGEAWLIVKRDLYWRPNGCGYTGIRDNAGRYSYDEAKRHEGIDGTTIVRLSEAPEFAAAAYHDVVISHLIKQRDDARAALAARPADNAALERAERMWCQACGTVTASGLCDCNRWGKSHEMYREPNFVNYADAMQEAAHEQAQENKRLRDALKDAIDVFDGMNDDEINEELLPRLRAALTPPPPSDNPPPLAGCPRPGYHGSEVVRMRGGGGD